MRMMKRGIISLGLLLLAFLIIPPVHEFIHSLNCFENGGEVVQVKYWKYTLCGGNVKPKLSAKINFIDNMNENITRFIFYPLLIFSFGQTLYSSLSLLRYYLKNGRRE